MNWLSEIREGAADLLFGRRCGICGQLEAPAICEVCRSNFQPFEPDDPPPNPLEESFAVFIYESQARAAVHQLKYERATSLARPMSELLDEFIASQNVPPFDTIIPVPIHAARLRERGFNQSELLCEALDSEMIDTKGLIRWKATLPQASLIPQQRRTNLIGAFRAQRNFDKESI